MPTKSNPNNLSLMTKNISTQNPENQSTKDTGDITV